MIQLVNGKTAMQENANKTLSRAVDESFKFSCGHSRVISARPV